MATYRGSDGSFKVGANTVGEIQSWRITASRPVHDTTKMGDTARTQRLDILQWEGEVTANFDYSDAQQKAIVDAMLGAAEPTALAGVFLVGTGKQLSGNVLPTNIPIGAQRGQLVSVTFSFTGTGPLTVTWA